MLFWYSPVSWKVSYTSSCLVYKLIIIVGKQKSQPQHLTLCNEKIILAANLDSYKTAGLPMQLPAWVIDCKNEVIRFEFMLLRQNLTYRIRNTQQLESDNLKKTQISRNEGERKVGCYYTLFCSKTKQKISWNHLKTENLFQKSW